MYKILMQGAKAKLGLGRTPAPVQHEFTGNYSSWSAALARTTGYAADAIFEKVRAAVLKVKRGEAAYERDAYLFDEIHHPWPLLACLLRIAREQGNRLRLLDFGGSLGSSYFQTRDFLQPLAHLSWNVVEQSHFVACGQQEIADGQLRFFATIEEALEEAPVPTLLLSGVLQCIPEPEALVRKCVSLGFRHILVDRTCFINDASRITVQNVPEYIYPASYPCWFFNEAEFLGWFGSRYRTVAQFDSYADRNLTSEDGKNLYWKGFYLEAR